MPDRIKTQKEWVQFLSPVRSHGSPMFVDGSGGASYNYLLQSESSND
jgi:hypothetical protein